MIPKYEQIMLPFLKSLADGNKHGLDEIRDVLADQFKLTDDELRQRMPSGSQTIFRSRVGWARTYLKKASLIISPERASFKITERGLSLLRENPKYITAKCLLRYDEFKEFYNPSKAGNRFKQKPSVLNHIKSDQTPEETIETTHEKLYRDLSKELLNRITSLSPSFFENLVIDLLITMGYGGSRKEAGEAIGKSGDGGIDGIINEDKLGLDVIYLQAKRWNGTVPIKEVRDFTGALAAKKARKGIFMTTSAFSEGAKKFVSQIEFKIILIDGYRLADLMIEYGLGVSTVNSYHIKIIDTDYFEEN